MCNIYILYTAWIHYGLTWIYKHVNEGYSLSITIIWDSNKIKLFPVKIKGCSIRKLLSRVFLNVKDSLLNFREINQRGSNKD